MGTSGTLWRIHHSVMHLREVAIVLLKAKQRVYTLHSGFQAAFLFRRRVSLVVQRRVCLAEWRRPGQIGSGSTATTSNRPTTSVRDKLR